MGLQRHLLCFYMNLEAATRWLLLSLRRFSSPSTTWATRKVLSVLLNPAQQMISRICHSPSQPSQTTPPLPFTGTAAFTIPVRSHSVSPPTPHLRPSSDSAVTPPLSLHLRQRADMTGRALCSSHTLMQKINRVSF